MFAQTRRTTVRRTNYRDPLIPPYSVCMRIVASAVRQESYSPPSRRITAYSACRTLRFFFFPAFRCNSFLLCSREKKWPTVLVVVDANEIEHVYPNFEVTAFPIVKGNIMIQIIRFLTEAFSWLLLLDADNIDWLQATSTVKASRHFQLLHKQIQSTPLCGLMIA